MAQVDFRLSHLLFLTLVDFPLSRLLKEKPAATLSAFFIALKTQGNFGEIEPSRAEGERQQLGID